MQRERLPEWFVSRLIAEVGKEATCKLCDHPLSAHVLGHHCQSFWLNAPDEENTDAA